MFYRLFVCFYFFFFNGLRTTAQKIEVIRIPESKVKSGPHLRFDPVTINVESFKKANAKKVILHDKQGYLWLKSEPNINEPLIRYDGNYSKAFKNSNWVLFESKKGNIVGTNDDGFAVFDAGNEVFRQYKNPFVKYKDPKLEHRFLYWQMMGNDNDLWFVQQHDENSHNLPLPLFRFDYINLRFIRFLPKNVKNAYSDQNGPEEFKQFLPLITTPNGWVWGMALTTQHPHSLAYFDPATRQCVSFPITISTPEMKIDSRQDAFNFLHNIVFDGRYLWLGHDWFQIGLLRFDTQTHQWKRFLFSKVVQNRISSIAIKNKDELWFKNGDHLTVFDKNTFKSYLYTSELGNPFALMNYGGEFYSNSKNTIWFGMDSNAANENTLGFLDLSKQYFRRNTLLPEKATGFRTLLKKENKHIYLYHNDNYMVVAEHDETTKSNKELWRYVNKKGEYIDIVGALDDRVNQKLWLFGSTDTGGLFELDKKKGIVVPIKAEIKGLGAERNRTEQIMGIGAYCQDQLGNVWFADVGRLIKFNHLTKAFEGFRIYEGLKKAINETEEISSIMTDSQGIIWIGYRSGFLVLFDPNTQKATLQKVFLSHPDGYLRKIVEDKARKVVWLSKSDMGLWKYDQQKRAYSKVSAIESLYNMHLTKKGIMWVRSSTNLIRYNPDNGDIQKFGAEYDLSNFDWTSFGKTSDDGFYFGKFRFRDEDIKPDTIKPNVVFSYVNVFDQALTLPKSLNYIDALELSHDQNFFSVGFSALSYFQQNKNQYAYQLVGFNKDWVNVGNKPLATFTNVPPDEYVLQIKGSNYDGTWSDVRSLRIIIHPAFWQTWWFKTLLGLLTLGVVYSVYRYQLNQKTLKNRLKAEEALRKQREAELSNRIAHTEMAALRAQMNPHFIFNCLNSIQLYTTQNSTEKATEYLTKFSRLIRLVLENSRSEKVTLENELETLRLYLEMEVMRFRGKVNYHITITQSIDQSYIQIPPLLLQPFVENAIWHGLMHKDEGGTVRIEITQPNTDVLQVEITDDGIGRQKAGKFKSKSVTQNKSYGMKVTAERIELINQLYNTTTQVQIVDLKNNTDEAIGTKVTVKIPI
ncbi:sensor histidine kinase [Runella aurantiaca]|uniref:Signal transduction histidine kinase internal region domain-containing protein n=1 Tax=Runella aurantiaca TaxID=2282308 RepID=A0A369I0V6_9BACT|nr:histidine kinase [Runella aurantiaca]RDB03421.1 hypothetical protein DVG78_24055 [Runella aurantiaca]